MCYKAASLSAILASFVVVACTHVDEVLNSSQSSLVSQQVHSTETIRVGNVTLFLGMPAAIAIKALAADMGQPELAKPHDPSEPRWFIYAKRGEADADIEFKDYKVVSVNKRWVPEQQSAESLATALHNLLGTTEQNHSCIRQTKEKKTLIQCGAKAIGISTVHYNGASFVALSETLGKLQGDEWLLFDRAPR